MDRVHAAAHRAGREPDDVQLIAVSKMKSVEQIDEAFSCGQTVFGENYIQEASVKIAQLDPGIRWHFIGHLQSNKAAMAATMFDVVETIDRVKVARALNRTLAGPMARVLPVLIQINIGREPQKAGVTPENVVGLLLELQLLKNIRAQGLMAVPPYSADPEAVRPYFRKMRELSLALRDRGLLASEGKMELSMGMSGDYETAIEEGATMIRVGTALFGDRC